MAMLSYFLRIHRTFMEGLDQEDVHMFWSRPAEGAVILWISFSILW